MQTIFWADVDCATDPGRYPFDDGHAVIEEKHLQLWEAEPAGFFKITRLVEPANNDVRYLLSNFDV